MKRFVEMETSLTKEKEDGRKKEAKLGKSSRRSLGINFLVFLLGKDPEQRKLV